MQRFIILNISAPYLENIKQRMYVQYDKLH